jgi:hypothetical protein
LRDALIPGGYEEKEINKLWGVSNNGMPTSTCILFFEMHPQRVEEEIQDVCFSIILKKVLCSKETT